MGTKYDVNHKFFDVIDTQDKAYILGLLYADGCNYETSGKIKIDLIEDDLELLGKVKKAMGYTGEIKHYTYEKNFITDKGVYSCKPTVRLSINSKEISEQLSAKGCTQNKTYNLLFPKETVLPKEFLSHFIRGYMDGDGGISYWTDNKNTKHKKFCLYFCGTTEVIKGIGNIIDNMFNSTTVYSRRFPERDNNNLQSIICGNKQIKNILDWIYKDANIYMDRKYNKYLELIEEVIRVEKDDTLYGNAFPRRKVINLRTLEIYSGVNEAAKRLNVTGGTILNWCNKIYGLMYLDEYEKIEDKNNIVINEITSGLPKKVYCVETDTIYDSISQAQKETNISKWTISRMCKGEKCKVNKYHFSYV